MAGKAEADAIRGMGDGSALEDALKKAQQKTDFGMSDDESKKFIKAFEEPEFRKLLAEYVEDISDPKHREEQNRYIRELEAKGDVPAGKDPIHPTAGFVVKTRKVKGGADDPTGAKVFVNVVSHERIAEPSSAAVEGGATWSLPHVLGPPRMEQDKAGSTASTFDCCFHPRALAMAAKQRAFRDLIVLSAFETVEQSYSKHGNSETLQRAYHVIRGCDYKTGEPQVIMLAKPAAAAPAAAPTKAVATPKAPAAPKGSAAAVPTEAAPADADVTKKSKKKKKKAADVPSTGFGAALKGKLSATIDDEGAVAKALVAARHAAESAPKASFSDAVDDVDALDDALADDAIRRQMPSRALVPAATAVPEAAPAAAPTSEVPKYTIRERGFFDLADHTMDMSLDAARHRRRPKEIVVSVELPRCASAADVDLDVSERSVSLTAPNGGLVYNLAAKLAYPVDATKGAAKFDRKTRTLSVTVSVLPPPPDQLESAPLVSDLASDAPASDAPASDAPAGEPPAADDAAARGGAAAERPKAASHSRWLDTDRAHEAPSRSDFARDALEAAPDAPAAAAPAEAREAAPAAPGDAKSGVAAPAARGVAAPAARGAPPTAAAFVPSDAFVGAKPGYVFKNGAAGLGYYADKAPAARAASASAGRTGEAPLATVAGAAPAVEWRQQRETISLLVAVAGAHSIVVTAAGAAVGVTFAAGGRNYALSVSCAGAVDAARCRAEAADKNVVVVLQKAVPQFWDEPAVTVGPVVIADAPAAPADAPPPAEAAAPASAPAVPVLAVPVARTTFKNTLLFEID
ncbi:pre-RNA processing PIH1/Nop17-domain-containing protein [Pelagophyceae sp. CCMP2097]|nr:pre-RNA processing PIH1/Nop17-domain-containing protein [Pelagophyceae sp. CCMP2097]